jgi:hypothetical protein
VEELEKKASSIVDARSRAAAADNELSGAHRKRIYPALQQQKDSLENIMSHTMSLQARCEALLANPSYHRLITNLTAKDSTTTATATAANAATTSSNTTTSDSGLSAVVSSTTGAQGSTYGHRDYVRSSHTRNR